MNLKNRKPTWNLETLFPGGSGSSELNTAIQNLKGSIQQLEYEMDANLNFSDLINHLQNCESQQQELESFIECLKAQNASDSQADRLIDLGAELKAHLQQLSHRFNQKLTQLPHEEFESLIKSVHPLSFVLKERKVWAKSQLHHSQEQIISQLSIDGYRGWSELYHSLMGRLKIPHPDEQGAFLSVGQAENLLSHPNREKRQKIFFEMEKVWEEHRETFAHLLNHLAGFRLKVYKERGWPSILKEPLFYNRMQESTLNAMWEAIEHHKSSLLPYLAKKADLLGTPQLSWFDLEAPLPSNTQRMLPFEEAADLIIKQFGKVSSSMSAFAEHAFEQEWIEAEDRLGKMPGGFCAQFPKSKQSRIFMTFGGTSSNLFTLAHELGHAYHNYIVKDLPMLNQQYRMNVAETASTFAEMILIDSIIQQTKDPKEKLSLLDNKIQRSIIFLMNIHARFIFESRFYQERQKGFVSAQDLNNLMIQSQQKAFQYSLKDWHPYFWVSKRHFYLTDVPFYNFPYTFGYLFSLGLYSQAKQKGQAFEEEYNALLIDTGQMEVEDLAFKHLGVNLSHPEFWVSALNLVEEDINQFLQISH